MVKICKYIPKYSITFMVSTHYHFTGSMVWGFFLHKFFRSANKRLTTILFLTPLNKYASCGGLRIQHCNEGGLEEHLHNGCRNVHPLPPPPPHTPSEAVTRNSKTAWSCFAAAAIPLRKTTGKGRACRGSSSSSSGRDFLGVPSIDKTSA